MTELVVSVHGVDPAPQGSKKHVGGGRMVESSKAVKPWRAAVVEAAKLAIRAVGDWTPLDGNLEMIAIWYLRPPKTMPRDRTGPTVPPDSSKLLRSTEDALTDAGVIVDDARITRHFIEKRYATTDRPVGVWLRIRHRQERS